MMLVLGNDVMRGHWDQQCEILGVTRALANIYNKKMIPELGNVDP